MDFNIRTSAGESRIIESFSKHVKTYDRNAQLQKAMAERLASILPENLPERVLELGCGTGLFTRHLLTKSIRQLILNDIAQAMLDHLKTNLYLPKETQFIIANAERILFDPVDLMVANAVFQWFYFPKETLQHLVSSLKPGGQLIFSTFGPRTLQEFRQAACLLSPAQLLSEEQWKALIRQAGLSLHPTIQEIRKTFYPNTLTLLKNLQQIGAAPYRIKKTGELRKLIKDYDAIYSNVQGVYATWELFYFSASKPSSKFL